MKYFIKHFNVFKAYLNISWKNSIEYMNDFIVLCLDFIVSMAITIIFWENLLVDYETLGKWSTSGLILIGIFGNASWAIGEVFAGAWELSEKITEGKLDKYLCRPVNTLIALILEDMQIEELFKGVISLAILMTWYQIKFDKSIIFGDLILSVLSLAIGIIIVAIVRCIYGCCAFWFENTDGLNIFIHMEDFGLERYPLDIFNNFTKLVLVSLIPTAFVSYFPAMFYLHMFDYSICYFSLEIIIMLIFAWVLHLVWKRGIKKYEATGG